MQFLSGKEKIQAEVCYTLDTLIGQSKRLVFTSCYLPGEIGHLSQELRSRLTGGLITPIGPPDFPTRVNILDNKAKRRGVQVYVKILEYLAEYVDEDVRRLESPWIAWWPGRLCSTNLSVSAWPRECSRT